MTDGYDTGLDILITQTRLVVLNNLKSSLAPYPMEEYYSMTRRHFEGQGILNKLLGKAAKEKIEVDEGKQESIYLADMLLLDRRIEVRHGLEKDYVVLRNERIFHYESWLDVKKYNNLEEDVTDKAHSFLRHIRDRQEAQIKERGETSIPAPASRFVQNYIIGNIQGRSKLFENLTLKRKQELASYIASIIIATDIFLSQSHPNESPLILMTEEERGAHRVLTHADFKGVQNSYVKSKIDVFFLDYISKV